MATTNAGVCYAAATAVVFAFAVGGALETHSTSVVSSRHLSMLHFQLQMSIHQSLFHLSILIYCRT
jgi:hypothetical protein